MELFILRPGEAGQRSASSAGDRKRALTSTGKLQISEIAKALKIIGLKFDLILTSPLKRAYDTATIVSKVFNIVNKVQVWDELSREGQKIQFVRNDLSKIKANIITTS
jgi:phosphohistidine phosphatase